MLRQKILKTRCLRLAKNAFAIQHLLHHSIIYTFIHYPTIVLLRWTCISEVIPAVQLAFFLFVRVFPLNLSFYLNFYNYIFLSWGNIFWELKKFSGTNGPVVRYFFHPCTSRPSPLAMSESLTKYSIKGHHERSGHPCLNIFKFYNNARDIYNYIQTMSTKNHVNHNMSRAVALNLIKHS